MTADYNAGIIEVHVQWYRPLRFFRLWVPQVGITVLETKQITLRRMGTPFENIEYKVKHVRFMAS